jgi:hypothetical protein
MRFSNLLSLFAEKVFRRDITHGSLLEGEGKSTVDLLVLTSLEKLLFILKIVSTFLTKQATLMRRSFVLSIPPQFVFPASAKLTLSPQFFSRISFIESLSIFFRRFGHRFSG